MLLFIVLNFNYIFYNPAKYATVMLTNKSQSQKNSNFVPGQPFVSQRVNVDSYFHSSQIEKIKKKTGIICEFITGGFASMQIKLAH